MAVANIGKKDIVWTLLATLFKIGAGVFLFPFILRYLPSETIGIWTIFTTITQVTFLLDFGFNASFARNISYVFSGVNSLRKTGYETVEESKSNNINYQLLSNTVKAMKYFYSRMALVLFLLLISVGSLYVYDITEDYKGNKTDVLFAWIILVIINCYNLYTLYYESLMNGRGLVKKMNQYILLGNVCYITSAIVMILNGFGLVSIVSSQAISVIIIRYFSKRAFYTKEISDNLKKITDNNYKEVLTAVTPNAVKVGLTSLGGFIINKSSMFIGSLFVSLELMASYGITLQLITVVGMMANIITRVYMPKVFQWRVEGKMKDVKRMFYSSSIVLICVFLLSGTFIVIYGNAILELLHSQTYLVPKGLLILIFVQYCLEYNHANAASYLLSKNEVPFFKASLISAFVTLVLLVVFVIWLKLGLLGMILAPTIAQALYQNWKWPLDVIIEMKDVK